uniref:Uncharacterized protein n=1 Tax=Heterorhabditis bacteriophora TaxID=37862 RepID=A0A1I7XUT9_HETBA
MIEEHCADGRSWWAASEEWCRMGDDSAAARLRNRQRGHSPLSKQNLPDSIFANFTKESY